MQQPQGNNYYFEQEFTSFLKKLDDEALVNRIDRAQKIINDIEQSVAYQCLLEDSFEKKEYIDETWFTVQDKNTLDKMRVARTAVQQIVNLRESYVFELQKAQDELNARKDEGKLTIEKDFDNG